MTRRKAHYAARIAKDICEQIALGKTLQEALDIVGYLAPTVQGVWHWLDAHADFREMYERARQLQADTHADQMLTLSRDVISKPNAAAAYRVAIDVLKWQAEVRNRRRYGNKSDDAGKDKPMDAAKLRAEIKRLEEELGVVETKVVPLKAVKGTK